MGILIFIIGAMIGGVFGFLTAAVLMMEGGDSDRTGEEP